MRLPTVDSPAAPPVVRPYAVATPGIPRTLKCDRTFGLAVLPFLPPRKVCWHVLRNLVRKFRRTLLQKRRDSLFHIRRRTAPKNSAAVHLVRFHRVVGACHLPQHLPNQRDRHLRGVVGYLARERTRRRNKLIGLVDLFDQPAFERLLGRENAPREGPFQRLRDADNLRQEPARTRLRHDAAP